jgi:hypothetical protein
MRNAKKEQIGCDGIEIGDWGLRDVNVTKGLARQCKMLKIGILSQPDRGGDSNAA